MDLRDLLNQEKFLEKLSDAQNMGEVKELFSAEGVTVTEEQLLEYLLPEGDELTEEALDNVAGGASATTSFFSWLHNVLRKKGGSGSHGF